MGRKKKDYHVEVLLKARVAVLMNGESGWEYCVKWAGYDEPSWEPEDYLTSCSRLLKSFWDEIGHDNSDYYPGHEVEPSAEWIEQEKKYFDQTFGYKLRKKRNRSRSTISPRPDPKAQSIEEEDHNADASMKAKQVAEELFGPSPVSDSAPDNHDARMSPSPHESPKLQPGIPKKRKVTVDSSSEDEPLANKAPPKKTQKKTHAVPATSAAKVERLPPNPQAKIARLPPGEIPERSTGITTKQRLGQGALAPTRPKDLIGKPVVRKDSVMSKLKFARKPTYASGPSAGPSTGSVLQDGQAMPLRPSIMIPRPMHNSPTIPQTNPTPASSTGAPSFPSPMLPAADAYLRKEFPPQAPAATSQDVIAPKPPSRPALPTRIPKQFKWHGELCLKSATQEEKCRVQIDTVSDLKSGETTFASVFQQVESIEVASMYDFADFHDSIVPVYQPPRQIARLTYEGEGNEAPFSTIVNYMEEFQKVFFFPIEDPQTRTVTGHVVFLTNFLLVQAGLANQPPPGPATVPSLACALLLYTLPEKGYLEYQLKKDALVKEVPAEDPIRSVVANAKALSARDMTLLKLQHAMRVLEFPASLYKYINDGSQRPFMIWNGVHGQKETRSDEVETKNLERVMQSTINHRRMKDDVNSTRIFFIHVNALDTVHELEGCMELRATKVWIYFFTYGSSPKVPPSMWGVREIWPSGGIVTFTPTAIARDPVGTRNLIVQISRHPLWACYVLPVALGAAAAQQCGSQNPLDLLAKKEVLLVEVILDAIERGDMALLEAPPEKWTYKEDTRAEWSKKYIRLIPPTKSEALELAVKAFSDLQTQTRSGDLNAQILSRISEDASRMERNPAFIYKHRRYVVIQDEKDAPFKHKDGLEWLTIDKFDFQDEFFPKQEVGLPGAQPQKV